MSDLQRGASFFMNTGERPGQISSLSLGESGAKSLKNAKKITVRLTPQGLADLKEAIETYGDPSIKFDIHIGEKEVEGRTFQTGFMFVNTTQPKSAGGPAKQKVVKPTNTASEEMKKLG